MMPTPESHFEIRPRHDLIDVTSEYNPSLPGGNFGETSSPSSYHPPGSIPTPVLIAQKIAENQGTGAVNIQSTSLHRRSSLEPEKPLSPVTDQSVKLGLPTCAKPNRFPANISLVLGNRDHQNHLVPNVSLEERRTQMLANLSGSHPLLQHELVQPLEDTSRNIPRRSISFKDPTPDKSRMEALSKLGLTRNRAMSGGLSLLTSPSSSTTDPSVETSNKPFEKIAPQLREPSTFKEPNTLPDTAALPIQFQNTLERKPEVQLTESTRSFKENEFPPSSLLLPPPPTIPETGPSLPPPILHIGSSLPPPIPQTSYSLPPPIPEIRTSLPPPIPEIGSSLSPPIPEIRSSLPPPITQASSSVLPLETNAISSPTPEVTSLEFNLYGGKSVIVKPSVSSRSNPPTSPTSSDALALSPTIANPPELNSYGGKTKVVNQKKSDLPDILSSHIDKSRTLPTKPALQHTELNNYGGKSRTIRPTDLSNTAAKASKGPPPATAPRPPRHSYHGPLTTTTTTHQAAYRALSPEHKRRPASMFRPQGITVHFAGRGGSNESRKDALRKLGLLND